MKTSFNMVCSKLAAYDTYMAGVSIEDIARQSGVSKAVALQWVAEVVHAKTGTDLPINKFRELKRQHTRQA